MELLDEYILKFNNYPPLIQTFSYKNEMYVDLIKSALHKEKPITMEDIEQYIDKNKIRYDVV